MDQTQTRTLEDVRRLLNTMADWRVFQPNHEQDRDLRLADYQTKLLNATP